MRIVVDRARCMGTGNCVLTSPQFFGQDEDGIVEVLVPEPPDCARAAVTEAVLSCPAAALSIVEDDPGVAAF